MRRYLVFGLLILSAVLLQTTVLARFVTLFGVSPDLILVVVISFALLEGPAAGAGSGFGGGLLKDLLIAGPKGLTGITYLVVGYVVGTVRPYVQATSVMLPILGVFAGSLVGATLHAVLSLLLGQNLGSIQRVAQVVALTAIYNAILVPFVYPLVRRIAAFYRTENVYRW